MTAIVSGAVSPARADQILTLADTDLADTGAGAASVARSDSHRWTISQGSSLVSRGWCPLSDALLLAQLVRPHTVRQVYHPLFPPSATI